MAVTVARVTSSPQTKTKPHHPGKGGAAAAGLRDLAIAHPFGPVQAQLTISQPTDALEVEADYAAEQAMGMTGPAPLARSQPLVQRRCAHASRNYSRGSVRPRTSRSCSGRLRQAPITGRRLRVVARNWQLENGGSRFPNWPEASSNRALAIASMRSGSIPVRRARMRRVPSMRRRSHTEDISCSARDSFAETHGGCKLLAHELAHTVQQGAGVPHAIQRTIGDGHDLQAPRFALNVELEQAFDGELEIGKGSPHTVAVRLIQQLLVDQGYTLPGFGVDGIFGDETEAAVKVFQSEAGAVLIDGIVGRETMGLLDLHDITRLTGPGPVPSVGPRPGPRPPPAPGCDAPINGVTFTLANTRGAGATPAANIRVVRLAGGVDFFQMNAIDHAHWDPDVTINAPSDPVAQ